MMMMMTLMKRMRIFFKMIYAGVMLGQTYVDMFVKKSSKDIYNKWNGVYVGAIQHSRRMP
jgi:hypothetical protein